MNCTVICLGKQLQTFVVHPQWGTKFMASARPGVEDQGNLIGRSLAADGRIGFLGQTMTQQPVGVLVAATDSAGRRGTTCAPARQVNALCLRNTSEVALSVSPKFFSTSVPLAPFILTNATNSMFVRFGHGRTHPMIENFVFILNNGIRTGVNDFLPDTPLLQQVNDTEFHPKAYEWESSGQAFTRMIDGCDTLVACPLLDGSGAVVLQSEGTYGPDNVVIVSPTNEVRQRIINPYPESRFFMPSDRFWFYAISVDVTGVVLNIQVLRRLEKYSRDAAPLYEATYEPASMQLTKLEWKPWT